MRKLIAVLGFVLTLAAALCGNLCIAPRLALADESNARSAAPAIRGKSSSQESNDAFRAAGWRLVRNALATAATSEAAVLHTADFERSDPRLAGLMLRCAKKGIEAIVVVVEPFPPQARPQITLRGPGRESQFVATMIPTGAGILLPAEAANLLTGPWRAAPEIEIKVADGGTAIDGFVALSGLPIALQSLTAECVQK
ncbi:MAG: hypothetical protein ACREDV_11800 [Methylocella sp.]